ncbi:phosphatase PAP2 family protein [Halalkalibacter urbisdiaboli]|uniref:phosphatase PAP2 family protein n=1 Tax=Halalkalibacter urbisdiaboli TaxID=1960589 RepID=UPI000B445853|nr:phosphatase PAP2 family protein [Halalkalibacter urbisdiaboli]
MQQSLELTQSEKATKLSIYSLVAITALLFVIPSQWERVQFFLLLLYPILLSSKYFHLDTALIKKSLLYIAIFLVANLSTFAIHYWQLLWEITNPGGLFGWKLRIDPILSAIPYNDGMWLRQFSTPLLDRFFVYIYIHGFVLCLLALCVYYLLTGQPKKILVAMLAGHFLQYLFILPFHFWVDGHQVWWIQNQWFGTAFTDPIVGYRTETAPVIPSLNHVFPSMHTSIAAVTILLALRETAKPVRHFFTILNVGIIISTVYLGIHWVIDVFGGVLFGYLTLKVADKLILINWKDKWNSFEENVYAFVNPLDKYHVKQHPFDTSHFWWDQK